VRAGDNQHGGCAGNRLIGVAEQSPYGECDETGPGREVKQERGSSVGQCLRARMGALRFRD
jgi:hypothetical protein